jgi:hypothetical protein
LTGNLKPKSDCGVWYYSPNRPRPGHLRPPRNPDNAQWVRPKLKTDSVWQTESVSVPASLRRSGWPTKEVSLTSWMGLLKLGQVTPVGRNLTYLDPSSSFRRRGSRLRWEAGMKTKSSVSRPPFCGQFLLTYTRTLPILLVTRSEFIWSRRKGTWISRKSSTK